MADGIVSCKQFASFLDTQSPYYDAYVMRDMRPEVSLIGMVKTGTWEAFTENQHYFDRFRHVAPNVTKPWTTLGATAPYPLGCDTNPCDKTEDRIGWGYSRVHYGLQEKSWASDLICYDQSMSFTKAVEHFAQIIEDVMRPATARIQSHKIRKEMAALAGSKKWTASATMAEFDFHWEQNADGDEIFLVLDSGTAPTSKLTPQMLQARIPRLQFVGYFGKRPFQDMPPLVELLTQMETLWDLDKQASANATAFAGIQGQFRFQDWSTANQYWKYAFSGQLGNYAVRVDPESFKFNRITDTRFQLVLPYINSAATVGLGSDFNDDYRKAIYGFSFIWHREAMVAETAQPASINPNMPFSSRNFGGEWKWVMHDLGTDRHGCVIENKRGNKGMFLADYKQAFKPNRPEWAETIFHQLAPPCTVAVATCAEDPGYPEQYYDSTNDSCDPDDQCLTITPVADGQGNYVIAANSIRVNGIPVVHVQISEATLAALVTTLNNTNYTNLVGTWDTDADDDTVIKVCGESSLLTIEVTWVV